MPIRLRQADWNKPGVNPLGQVLSSVGESVQKTGETYQQFLDRQARERALEQEGVARAEDRTYNRGINERKLRVLENKDMREGFEADASADKSMQDRDMKMKLQSALAQANEEYARQVQQSGETDSVSRRKIREGVASKYGLLGTAEGDRFLGKDLEASYEAIRQKRDALAARGMWEDARNRTRLMDARIRADAIKTAKAAAKVGKFDDLSDKALVNLHALLETQAQDYKKPGITSPGFKTPISEKAAPELINLQRELTKRGIAIPEKDETSGYTPLYTVDDLLE